MAAHSNRSPSPISSKPINPSSRTPDIYSMTRRSLNGSGRPYALPNPRKHDSMTPANSPSDFARRRSVGDAGPGSCLRNSEEKENDVMKGRALKLKASKLQSPAKGFMAPTISAASKFTPSPRKKPLVERNKAVRTSISLSNGKAMWFSNISKDSEPKPVQVSRSSKKVIFLDIHQDSQNVNESIPDSVISDPYSSRIASILKNNISCSSAFPYIAPLDADPSLPPYDPKTNYLSPIPQFLCYQPNPRVEILLNREKEMDSNELKTLEGDDGDDSFRNEIVSDNFLSYSEVSQESEREKLKDIATVDMVTKFEADDLSLYDEVTRKEKLKDLASVDIFEGLDFSENDLTVSGDSDEDKMEVIASADDMVATGLEEISGEENLNRNGKKLWGVSRLMCFSMVMMMLIAACVSVSVTRSPLLEEFVDKDLNLSDLGKLYHQSKAVSTSNAKVIWETCCSFFSKVANELRQGEKVQGPMNYANLSDLQKGSGNDVVEDDDDDNDDELDYNFEEEEEDADGVYECDYDFEDEVNEQEDEMSEIKEIVIVDSSVLDSEYWEDTRSPKVIVSNSFPTPHKEVSEIEEIVPTNSSELDSGYQESTESLKEIFSGSIISASQDQESEILFENGVDSGASLTEKSSRTSEIQSQDNFLAHYAVEISSFIVALSAVAVFIYQYKRIPNFHDKKTSYEHGSNKQKMQQEEISLCPSEMSSLETKNSKKEMTRGASEVHSLETKARKHYSKRESSASSSEFTMGSHSYGSFTTFEKISIKDAQVKEEIITPVRRSSRIRTQQFTSL